MSTLVEWCREQRPRFLAELKEWVAIPSVSADPAHRADVRRCAETIVARLRAAGFAHSELLETKGNPVAYGEWLGAPGKPTILIYGHYDVQPVDPIELWTSPPFELTERDGRVYGRGSVDDKGQVLMHVAALEAHLKLSGKLPLNVKVVIEGEEEIGSPNFENFLAAHRERLRCDLVVVSDTAVFAEDVPSLTTSLRGLVHWEVAVHGPSTDLHSGYFGGAVRNPIEALAQIIASLKDSNGRINVPHFYDDVVEPTAEQRRVIASLPYDEAREARALGLPKLSGEREYSALERAWIRPTLELNGIWGGYSGPGSKTIIPSWARAKISARLVADQDPHRIRALVRDAIIARAPDGVRIEVESDGDVRAVAVSRDHPAVAAAGRAMARGFGKAPAFIGSGGTIGPVSSFDRILGLPQVLIGVGLPDDAIHAPNERFSLDQFYRGIETMAYLYDELAAMPVTSAVS